MRPALLPTLRAAGIATLLFSACLPTPRPAAPTAAEATLPSPGFSVATGTPIPSPELPTQTSEPSDEPTATLESAPSAEPSAASQTESNTGVVTQSTIQPTTQVQVTATTAPSAGVASTGHTYFPPVVMANYLPWYDTGSWSNGCTADTPSAGPYLSQDGGTIARHIAEGQRAGLDGFNVHWINPGDRTDTILAATLAHGGSFKAAATFLNHSFTGAARGTIAANLSYIINTYGGHGNYLKFDGRPVIFFAGMPRVDQSGGLTPEAAWAEIRAVADPNRKSIWIAEGLEPSYLDVFDGLYVYKIDHNCCPYAYQSAERWEGWVRQAEQDSGLQKYWAATIQPGWNDVLSTSANCVDNRVGVETFSRDREAGVYYERTFNSAMATRADILIVNSFNEWVEGSYIEPSGNFGDFYLDLTAQYAATYRALR